jgi:hypothetical protein
MPPKIELPTLPGFEGDFAAAESVHGEEVEANAPTPRRLTTVERAFELARSGVCHSVDEIAGRLQREQFEAVEAHLSGPQIRRDLRQLCAEARRTAGSSRSQAAPDFPL